MPVLADPALDQMFRAARTQNTWAPEPLPAGTAEALYDLAKWGPTSANCSPARFVFVESGEGKSRLAPHLSASNRVKVLAAPICVIVAQDMDFAEKLPQLFPHDLSARHWFGDPAVAAETAMRNSSLQGGYFLMAARAMGLDCGPMSGFDRAGVDAEFFSGTVWRSNFLINIGHGQADGVFPRNPRLAFEEACRIV